MRAAAAAFLSASATLNVLVCNAGIMMVPTREQSVDGWELQLATNYLGHFLLFWLLRAAMLRAAAATPAFASRLVNVSSSGHHASRFRFDDFNLAGDGAYAPGAAYGHSKLAQIYMANYVDRRYGPEGLHALSLMPGGVATGLQAHVPREVLDKWAEDRDTRNFVKSVEQGAATTVLAAVACEWEGGGGRYLEDCAEAGKEIKPGAAGVMDYAYDEEKEERLFRLTLEKLGLVDE